MYPSPTAHEDADPPFDLAHVPLSMLVPTMDWLDETEEK